jgi:hypothetical protein
VRTANRIGLAAAVIGAAAWCAAATAADPAPEPSFPAPPSLESAVRLFAEVEGAWAESSAVGLAALVDTAVVRIALKPGTQPTSAVTRSAAAFLFQDQLRLVKTRSFRVIKIEVDRKGKARAEAEWSGDWGGRQGARDVKVSLVAAISGNRWLLTEVRSND